MAKSKHKVIRVIDGDTFEVSPEWKGNYWKEGVRKGNIVRIDDYYAPEAGTSDGDVATGKLRSLIENKEVELLHKTVGYYDRLIADVFLNGKNILRDLPDYSKKRYAMKLTKVKITNFRSVEDSGAFAIDDVTCLVGKNESGKSAILKAMEGIKSSMGYKYRDVIDYPRRHLNEYHVRENKSPDVVITSNWALDDGDVLEVEEAIGAGVITSGAEVVIKNYYEEKGYHQSVWTIDANEKKVVEHLISTYLTDATENDVVRKSETIEKLRQALDAIGGEGLSGELQELKKAVGSSRSANAYVLNVLSKRRFPSFLYFAHYQRMNGKFSIDYLQKCIEEDVELEPGDQLFLEFLAYAGTTLEEIRDEEQSEILTSKLEAASLSITKKISDYWSQNENLAIKFDVRQGRSGDTSPFNSGQVMEVRVVNKIHGVSLPFDERSAGFVWFFSFLVHFSQIARKHRNKKLIILLDEPGVTLHGTAQSDLLEYINKELAEDHQVIYTTHSPSMIPESMSSVRTVEDISSDRGKIFGTKVREDILSSDKATLFPLQAAIGYKITQSLFIGPNTLLVEGPSDILYLQAFSSYLLNAGKKGLNEKWIICPTGGLDKVCAFVSLFYGNRINIAVLCDWADGGKSSVRKLKQEIKGKKILDDTHILTLDRFCHKEQADIEDMLEPKIFVELINRAYGLKGGDALDVDKLANVDEKTGRNSKKAESFFKSLPASYPEYNHFKAADWLIRNPSFLDIPGFSDAVSSSAKKFEDLFKVINALPTK